MDRGLPVPAATWNGDVWTVPGLLTGERERSLRLQRTLARATPGSNRRKRAKVDIATLTVRAADRRKDRVEKIKAAYTSYTSYTSRICAEYGYRAPRNRASQAVFRRAACGHADNADVNAARNVAAGWVVTAHGDLQP